MLNNEKYKKRKKQREKERRKKQRKEALILISILGALFIILLFSSSEKIYEQTINIFNGFKKDNGIIENSSIYTGKDDKLDSRENIKEEPKEEIDEKVKNKNNEEAKENIKNNKEKGNIEIKSTNFYIKSDTNILVVEGIVANYTERTLLKPIIKIEFYDDNGEVLSYKEMELVNNGELKPNMIIEFKAESEDEAILKKFVKGIDIWMEGKWK